METTTIENLPDWPLIQRRYEAWWQGEMVDRVPISITAPKAALPGVVVPPGQLLDYWTDPDRVMEREQAGLANTYYAGDAFPTLHPVSGRMVAILAAFLGAPLRLINTETTWTESVIEDWATRPAFAFDPENEWWRRAQALLAAGAQYAPGRARVCLPDLNGPGEILARLRGSDRLAVDLIDHPEEVLAIMPEMNRAWFRCWQACTGVIQQQVGGHVLWMGPWSELPATDLQTDFSIMISEAMFDRFFLPFIEEQTRLVQRTVYHLDGPGAARHLDSLLSLPGLDAIQWVPGAGAPPMSRWLPLLHRVQAKGKSLCLSCEPWEVEILLTKLQPEGLFLSTNCASPEEADALLNHAVGDSRRRPWLAPLTPNASSSQEPPLD